MMDDPSISPEGEVPGQPRVLGTAQAGSPLDLRARELLAVTSPATDDTPDEQPYVPPPCPCCGGRMVVIELIERRYQARAPPSAIRAPGSPAS